MRSVMNFERTIAGALSLICGIASAGELRVHSAAEIAHAAAEAQPGAVLVMANGIWTNQVISFKARGTAAAPIALRPADPGKVVLVGNSSLAVDGEHLVVSGIFLNGATASGDGMKRSHDLKIWRDDGLITLGQKDWPWAKGRLTAGFVLDLKNDPHIGKYLMFFHGSGPENEKTMFDNFASLGLAWSEDFEVWTCRENNETPAACTGQTNHEPTERDGWMSNKAANRLSDSAADPLGQ